MISIYVHSQGASVFHCRYRDVDILCLAIIGYITKLVPLYLCFFFSGVVPKVLGEMLSDSDTAKSQRAFTAMMEMKKIDIAALKTAFEG